MPHFKVRASVLMTLASLSSLLPALAVEPVPNTADEDRAANLAKAARGSKVGDPARYHDVFAPLRTENAALSPDGQLLACTVRTGADVYLHVLSADQPEVVKTRVLISRVEWDPASGSEAGLVRWLGWITPTRLVFSTNRLHRVATAGGGELQMGDISAINADGSDARLLVRPDQLGKVAYQPTDQPGIRLIGFHPGQADSVIFATPAREGASVARSYRHHSAYALNVVSGEVTLLNEKAPGPAEAPPPASSGTPNEPAAKRPPGKRLRPRATSNPGLSHITGLDSFGFSIENVLGRRAVPIGFGIKRDVFYFASNFGRDTYGIYSVDLNTRRIRSGMLESPVFDLCTSSVATYDPFLYYKVDQPGIWKDWHRDSLWWPSPQLALDRFTHEIAGVRYEGSTRTALWLRPELQEVQEWLAANRPGRSAEILEWDKALNRFLIQEQAPGDAGSYYVLDRQWSTYRNFARRGSQPEDGSIATLRRFEFALPDGSAVEGWLALPKESKVEKIPLVLLCPDLPWHRRGATYQPEFEALTRMGFAVALYNGRGVWGTGLKERQKLRKDYQELQVADVVAVADHLVANFPVSSRSVGLFGQGQGGFVALRALQLHPARFRCAVTVDAWVQDSALFDALVETKPLNQSLENALRPQSTPLVAKPELIKAPVFTILESGDSPRHQANTRLHGVVKKTAPESELLVNPDRAEEKTRALARQWARTESFLNYTLYHFNVKLGETKFLAEENGRVGRLLHRDYDLRRRQKP